MEITFNVETSTNFTFPGIKRKRLPGEPRLKPGPRPTKRPRKYQPRKAPTRLRKDRPLQTEISHDIWENILIFCPLEVLLRIRTLCKTFYTTLASDRVWKHARIHQYGSGHPDPPEGMKEMEYADLMVAVGCQDPKCDEKCTRRTYWAFRRRWCEQCCMANLSRERRAKEEIENYERSKKCIPYAMYDSWNHYQWAGQYEDPPIWTGTYGAQTPVFSRYDIKRYNDKYNDFMEPGRSDEEIEEWLSEQEKANEKYMKQLQKIETWVMEDMKQRERERANIREKRAAFFRKKASQLDPPLEADALELCPSYRKSADIAKLASEKSWSILREKVRRERKDAEAEAAKIKRRLYHKLYRHYLQESYDIILAKRQLQNTPEQELVLRLADQVIHNILVDPNGIDDSDIVNVVLRGVYDAYQKLPDEDKPSTPRGPYRLIMDDARYVYRKRIIMLTRCFLSEDKQNSVRRLCCPSARCQGMMEDGLFEFEDLMEHLGSTHPEVEDFDYLEMSYPITMSIGQNISLWYSLEWPRNLPMRAVHQSPQDKWDVDAEIPYKSAPAPGRPLLAVFADAVANERDFKKTRSGHFASDTIIQAALILRRLQLGTKRYNSSIALEFLHMRSQSSGNVTNLDVQCMMDTLKRAGLACTFPKQCCIRCQKSDPYSIHNHATIPFQHLSKHYLDRHCGEDPTNSPEISIPDTFKETEDEQKDKEFQNRGASPISDQPCNTSRNRRVSPLSDYSPPRLQRPTPSTDMNLSSSIPRLNAPSQYPPYFASLLNDTG